MGKKREDRGKEKARADRECNLDGDYVSPVRSCRDLSLDTIKDTLCNSRYVQILLSLTFIGLLLRFYNLGYNSLWLDEASTYTFATMSIPAIWEATAGGEFNPPLFYWIEHVMLVFGNNEFILRFVPSLLGVLTIPIVYLIGREFYDRNVGIIAAAGFTFSPFLIFYSQEARAYSMMLFFVALAMLFCLRALKTNDIKEWILFGVFSALAFWSHFYAVVMIGALVLYALIESLPKIRNDISLLKPMIAGCATCAILALPVIIITLPLIAKRTGTGPTFGIQGMTLIFETFRQILTSPFSLPGEEIAFFLLFVLFFVGIIQAFILNRNKGIFLVSLTILMFAISYLLSFKIPMMPRYLICLSLVLFLGVALSYKLVYSLVANRAVVYGFVILLFLMSIPFVMVYYSNYTKEDWRGVSSQLGDITKDGDYVIVLPTYVLQPLDYYYSNATDKTIEYGFSSADQLDTFSRQNTQNRTVYYLVTGDIMSADPSGAAFAWLKEHTTALVQTNNMIIFTSG